MASCSINFFNLLTISCIFPIPSSFKPVHLPPLPSLREIVKMYGLRAQKQLSQNFLLQPGSINQLVKCAGQLKDAFVLEVGPGPGSVTRAIIERGPPSQLAVVELDQRFLPCLDQLRLASLELGTRMDVYNQDILKFNADAIFPEALVTHGPLAWNSSSSPSTSSAVVEGRPLGRVVAIGNLPFNISTRLVIQWLHDIAERRGLWRYGRVPMTLTFQREVAQRLLADPWDEQRSRLSVMTQAYCQVEYKRDIPGTAFVPIPDVDAAVVCLTPLQEPVIPIPFPYLEKFVRIAFQFRQKQIVRCLEGLFPVTRPELVIQLFKEASVQPGKRPTELTLLEFRDLALVYYSLCKVEPDLFYFNHLDRHNLRLWRNRRIIQRNLLSSSNSTGDDHRQALTASLIRDIQL